VLQRAAFFIYTLRVQVVVACQGKNPMLRPASFPIEAAYAASTNPSSSLLRHTFLQ